MKSSLDVKIKNPCYLQTINTFMKQITNAYMFHNFWVSKNFFFRTENVVQLAERLPTIHKAPGLIPSILKTRDGDVHL